METRQGDSDSVTGELTYFASRKEALLAVVGGLAFVVGGWFTRSEHPVMGGLCVVFFGLAMVAGVMRLIAPRSTALRLTREGLEFVERNRTHRLRWCDVAHFDLGQMNGVQIIAIVYSPAYRQQQLGRTVARTLAGAEGAIADMYTVSLDELVVTLNAWRARYGDLTP